ncbi:hypothetical protein [Burkholderia glumae]|uniref:hypothetical protein n=1 Tax=Burkholderia glumae TaxID=337 RepID=UPI003B9C36AA
MSSMWWLFPSPRRHAGAFLRRRGARDAAPDALPQTWPKASPEAAAPTLSQHILQPVLQSLSQAISQAISTGRPGRGLQIIRAIARSPGAFPTVSARTTVCTEQQNLPKTRITRTKVQHKAARRL